MVDFNLVLAFAQCTSKAGTCDPPRNSELFIKKLGTPWFVSMNQIHFEMHLRQPWFVSHEPNTEMYLSNP